MSYAIDEQFGSRGWPRGVSRPGWGSSHYPGGWGCLQVGVGVGVGVGVAVTLITFAVGDGVAVGILVLVWQLQS